MAAIIVGTYDASTFVDGVYTTYPQLPPGVPFYQLGMGWRVTVAGVVHGQNVFPNDILFAVPLPRLYGDFTYGDKVFGSKPASQDDWEDWLVDEVQFLAWDGNLPPPDQVPYPNAGCPFTPAHGFGGEWAPGWRIVVDAWYDDLAGARRYGDFQFGAVVYGALENLNSGLRWVDITSPSFHIEVGDGMAEGGPRVSVSEVVIQFVDPAGRWFDIATPWTWRQPQPGTAIRVGLLDPQFRYHPLITAEVERIEDVHDGGGVREVSVRGFGRITDLVVDLPQVQRPAELASARYNWYAQAAGWRWDTDPMIFPPADPMLMGDQDLADVQAREQMDKTCSAAGWFMDSTREGRMRVRPWPHEPELPELTVVDCYGYPDTLVSHSMVLANDQSQLLNYVVTTNIEDKAAATPAVTVIAEDTFSVAQFGRRGRAFGFPQTGLSWADPAAAQVWADRAAARYAFITRQCESFDVDTAVDQAWLATLADLDTGRAVHIRRTGLTDLDLDGVIVGWRWRLDPGRWQGNVFVSTITPSL